MGRQWLQAATPEEIQGQIEEVEEEEEDQGSHMCFEDSIGWEETANL